MEKVGHYIYAYWRIFGYISIPRLFMSALVPHIHLVPLPRDHQLSQGTHLFFQVVGSSRANPHVIPSTSCGYASIPCRVDAAASAPPVKPSDPRCPIVMLSRNIPGEACIFIYH